MHTRLTYANVVATLALFIALGGGAYAAVKLPRNSVGSKQIKGSAVTSAKVRNATLLARDFKRGQLPAGPTGPAGPAGSSASINGVAAGGDLTGTYPNPTIGPRTVGGAEIADGSLTGADIDESTLTGVPVHTSAFTIVPAQSAPRIVLDAPGVGYLTANCTAPSATTVGLQLLWSPASDQRLVALYGKSLDLQADGGRFAANQYFTAGFDADSDADLARFYDLTIGGPAPSTVRVVAITREDGEPRCSVSAQFSSSG